MRTSLLCFAVLGLTLGAEEVTCNGDFEQVEIFSSENSHYKTMVEKGWAIDQPLRVPKAWCPNSGSIAQGEFRLIENRKDAHSGTMSIRLKGDCYQTMAIPVQTGTQVELSFWAKAANPTDVSGILYAYAKDAHGAVAPLGDSLSFTVQAGETWAQYTHTFTIPGELGGQTIAEVNAALRCYTGASFDDIVVTVIKP
jgi:hypothetical protein